MTKFHTQVETQVEIETRMAELLDEQAGLQEKIKDSENELLVYPEYMGEILTQIKVYQYRSREIDAVVQRLDIRLHLVLKGVIKTWAVIKSETKPESPLEIKGKVSKEDLKDRSRDRRRLNLSFRTVWDQKDLKEAKERLSESKVAHSARKALANYSGRF